MDVKDEENLPSRSNEVSGAAGSLGHLLDSLKDDSMTVEQFLLAERDKLINEVENYSQELIDRLRRKYGDMKERYMEHAKNYESGDEIDANAMKGPVIMQIELTVLDGKYQGETFKLEAKQGHPIMIGRSRGKQFTAARTGISLPKDKEVSTSHAKIELTSDNEVVYVDVGSTNGSRHNDVEVEAKTRVLLKQGDELGIGSNIILVASLRQE
mmetsp:Transcript_12501/g.22285  ORF Transcript_12501/g.22285 Transcript_12501/m.22285 type:complete len:212 (+) Transcript_12501:40-675(+)|eukprot:CAMPEP_0184516138 /NCGR_PEP_ID=MMETSP0198_2-20121128/4869_1 /TAXON_ID=1112570 /ORGANISM="Thraustochytrium sp., Strain LLF1b" /LENGTH=211 /DNA_ID=CAMNT_0026906439 /DNA_START=83 /DNA_END=718 /DNA_ORIENTATION=-